MKFEKLFTLLKESSFSDLPSESPYGYWIHPNGDFTVVQPYCHEEAADTIVSSNKNLLERYNKWKSGFDQYEDDRAMVFIAELNYIQAVTGALEKTLHWRNLKRWYAPFRINNGQKRTLHDLASYYGLQLVEDWGGYCRFIINNYMNFRDYFNDMYLEAFEHALNFLTDPSNKDKTLLDVEQDFINAGGEKLGRGINGTAYTHPSWNYVLKTFYYDGCYVKFVRYAQKKGLDIFPKFYGSPHRVAPSFTRHVAQEKIFVVRMEKLNRLSGDDATAFSYLAQPGIFKLFDKHEDNQPITANYIEQLSEGNKQVERLLFGVRILLVDKYFQGCREDLHSGNIMVRPNGEWVITDPAYPSTRYAEDEMKVQSDADRQMRLIHRDKFMSRNVSVDPNKIISGTEPVPRKLRRNRKETRQY